MAQVSFRGKTYQANSIEEVERLLEQCDKIVTWDLKNLERVQRENR